MASPPQAPAHEEVKRSLEPGAAAAKGSRSGNSSMVGLPPKSNQTLDKKFKNFVKNSFKTNKKSVKEAHSPTNEERATQRKTEADQVHAFHRMMQMAEGADEVPKKKGRRMGLASPRESEE